MKSTFSLCPRCLDRFRALQFSQSCRCGSNQIPFNSIYWSDELPAKDDDWDFLYHEVCMASLIRLYTCRKILWTTGSIPDRVQDFWLQTQQTLPNWPGFRRLALSLEQLAALRDCDQETCDPVNSMKKDALVFSLTDQGDGVVKLVAHPTAKPPSDGSGQKPGDEKSN